MLAFSCTDQTQRLNNIRLQNISYGLSRDGVWFGNRICWTFTPVSTNTYDSLTELRTPKTTATTAHISLLSFH
jgi:hypothetical protein